MGGNKAGALVCVLGGLLVFWGLNGMAEINLESNVSYQSVTELGFRDADKRLVYGHDNPDLQYGLLWLPDQLDKTVKAPLIVFIHGGCWLNAFDIRHTYALSSALASAGYAVWSLEYRRSGDVGGAWPGTFDDIKLGVAFTSALEEYPVDTGHMVLMGHSAGGHLALLAGAETDEADAVIGLAAITDIIEYSRGENSCQRATLEFMNGDYESNPAAYHAANPAGRRTHRNTILLQGTSDKIVPQEQATMTGARSVLVEEAGHFDWLHPGTKAHRRLLSTLEELFNK